LHRNGNELIDRHGLLYVLTAEDDGALLRFEPAAR
jgi:hypothetical protein